MIRPMFILAIIASFAAATARAQQTDPSQYRARMAKETQQYLADCTIFDLGSSDRAACDGSTVRFINEYYQAFEGNVDDQWDIGYMFTLGVPYAVIPDPVLACAWQIVADDNGGPPSIGPSAAVAADQCRQSIDNVAAAHDIEAEMAKVENLTY